MKWKNPRDWRGSMSHQHTWKDAPVPKEVQVMDIVYETCDCGDVRSWQVLSCGHRKRLGSRILMPFEKSGALYEYVNCYEPHPDAERIAPDA